MLQYVISVEGKQTKHEKDAVNVCGSPVVNETSSTFLNGFISGLSVLQDTSLYFQYEDTDDDFVDPDYTPEDDGDSDISAGTEHAGKILERNLMDLDDQQNILQLQHEDLDPNHENGTESASVHKDNRKSKKLKRNTGKSYVNSNEKLVAERKIRKLEDCRKNCKNLISAEDQQTILDQYWGLGSYDLRQAYVCGLIAIEEKKTERKNKSKSAPRTRTHTNYYFLEIHGNRVPVCQKCFRYTLCETEQFIKTVVKKKLESPGPIALVDQRGRHAPTNKLPEEKEREIQDHINSFPAYESHYTRRDTSQKYLRSDLTVAKMYSLYCEKYDKPASISKYLQIFNTMGLKFKPPRADTCKKCDVFKIKLDFATEEERSELEFLRAQHQKDSDLAYQCKAKDKDVAKSNPSIAVFTFDLQQCLPTPYLRTSVSFYKRPLWTFNFTIHDCISGQPYCYMWHEASGRRGGNEISSSIFRHLQSISPGTKKKRRICWIFSH